MDNYTLRFAIKSDLNNLVGLRMGFVVSHYYFLKNRERHTYFKITIL